MSRNGSGTFSLVAGNPVVTGSTISSTTMNNTLSDIATEITRSLASDGQTVPTANLPMGAYKHTNVANATSRTDYCTAGQAQDNVFDWLTGISGTDTIVATAPIAVSSYAAGQTFRFVSAGANTTTSPTLNINSIGAKSITKLGSVALSVGNIPSGCVIEVVYDGTRFQLVGIASNTAINATTAASCSGNAATATISASCSGSAANVTGTVAVGNGGTGLTSPGSSGNILTSNGSGWVSSAPPSNGLGIGQTWQNVLGSRISGTTYTNSTGKPITVICGQSGSGSATTLTVTVGGVSFGGQSTISGGTIILTFVVPDGATYSATLGVSFTIWMELR